VSQLCDPRVTRSPAAEHRRGRNDDSIGYLRHALGSHGGGTSVGRLVESGLRAEFRRVYHTPSS